MSSLFNGNPPITPIKLNQRPNSVSNFSKNNNRIFQPLESNNYKMEKKNDFFSLNKTQNKVFYNQNKPSDYHPLDFYTLGKVNSNIAYPTQEWNKGIKSTSNDIITRNSLSINTKKFNNMNLHKNLSYLNEQNIDENNYMNPVKIYKTCQKYDLPKYATNIEMYRLMKEKYFARDIHSAITQGKCLSKKEFIKQKERILKKDNLSKDDITSNIDKNIEGRNIKKEVKKEINKNNSVNTGSIFKDPNDYTKQLLKDNYLYFDKNNNQMIKQRKWPFKGKR